MNEGGRDGNKEGEAAVAAVRNEGDIPVQFRGNIISWVHGLPHDTCLVMVANRLLVELYRSREAGLLAWRYRLHCLQL